MAGYAVKSAAFRGRQYLEKEHEVRTPFQRDRDRVLHSTAFRRLQYKTQVFVNDEGDHFRTRLTHTLETCQIARTIARALALNEDLVEAIALAHDLGHGPFGHAGQWALQEMMKGHGGFEHNEQCLRIVEELESSYAEFPGLNLSFETREGLKKHPERFYPKGSRPFRSLEADVVDVADEIAYNSHDLDDGLRAGLIREEDISELGIWRDLEEYIGKKCPPMPEMQRKRLAIRLLINYQVTDVVDTTSLTIKKLRFRSVEDLQKTGRRIVGFSPKIRQYRMELRRFLHRALYQHERVVGMAERGKEVVRSLFKASLRAPEILSEDMLARQTKYGLYRAICDYVSGMTDRFALETHERIIKSQGPVAEMR